MAGSLMANVRARKMLSNVLKLDELPELPSLALKVLGSLRDPDVEFAEVAEALGSDPALTIKVLGTVNSSAYAPQNPINDVRQALSYIGRSELEQIVLAVAVRGALPSDPAPGFDPRRFWRTAARRAALGRAFAERLHPARAGEAFTATLLLDMGVPAMVKAIGAPYSEALLEWHASPNAELHDIERDRLSLSHTRVGSLLAASLDLPPSLSQAIAKHHDPSASSAELLPAVRLMSRVREVEAEGSDEQLVETARADYGIEPDWTLGAIEASGQAATELAKLLAS